MANKEDRIPLPSMGEMLVEEYMKPYGLSVYRLAKEIHVPVSRLQDIIYGRRRMTADTSLRLEKFYGLSEGFFLRMQNTLDLMATKEELSEELDSIVPISGRDLHCGSKGKRKTISDLYENEKVDCHSEKAQPAKLAGKEAL